MTRGGKLERVGAVVPRLLRKLGIADRVSAGRTGAAWREAVGDTIARRAAPLGVRSGILWVAVDGSAWMQELSGRRREIARRLDEKLGSGVVRDLRFVLAGSREAQDAPAPDVVSAWDTSRPGARSGGRDGQEEK